MFGSRFADANTERNPSPQGDCARLKACHATAVLNASIAVVCLVPHHLSVRLALRPSMQQAFRQADESRRAELRGNG